jgi:hypothetical protein
VQVRFNGQPGQVYQIQSSTNEWAWAYRGDAMESDSEPGMFLFDDPTDATNRFYRAFSP